MIENYVILALRNIAKNRLYAFINIVGLAVGLCIFVFSDMLTTYEYNHDNMFSNRDRIFSVGSVFAPTANESITEFPNVRTAYAPLFELEIAEIARVARAIFKERVLTVANSHYYQGIRFVDPDFTRIFDFQYIYGDSASIDNPRGIIITASTARKLFGRVDVLGEVVSLEHKYDMQIAAVIRDIASDSHFESSLLPNFELSVIAPISALTLLDDFDVMGEWKTMEPFDMTYILLPKNLDRAWLENQVNAVATRHAPKNESLYISRLRVRPLIDANTMVWDSLGFPVLETAQLLGLLILIIACVNYANLATAQSFSRTQEVGLRKTFGAGQGQLMTQFLVESLAIVFFAMLLALSFIEFLLPVYNSWTGKNVLLIYMDILPWLVLVTALVGLIAGLYPAYIISRLNPIEGLHRWAEKNRSGGVIRNLMIAAQFAVSIFMLAMVMIIYFQNGEVQKQSSHVPKSEVVVIEGVDAEQIRQKHDLLRRELMALPDVQAVSFSSTVPFWSMSHSRHITPEMGDETLGFEADMVSIDASFFRTYDMPLLAGRNFDRNISSDYFRKDSESVNVIVNQLAAEYLGFGRGKPGGLNVIGQSFYKVTDEDYPLARVYTIVGLKPDSYFYGMTSKMKPIVFIVRPDTKSFASIRLRTPYSDDALKSIDQAWERVINNYPIRRSFLDYYFNQLFRILQGINNVFAAFAGVAMLLALVGLFGLTAFMAQRRTKEIGIRKVMGASENQIIGLLVWQFSKPVAWSLLLALPLAYMASSVYLDFFPIRIQYIIPVIIFASIVAIIAAWCIVASHAVKVARMAPIYSLRYE